MEDEYIALDDCEHRGFYRIQARNFDFGVFDQTAKGFIGIREKFGTTYLFTEYHWDTGAPFGTVRPIELLEPCPIRDTRESYILCSQHKMPIIHVEDPGSKRIIQRLHFDGSLLENDDSALSYDNRVLFNWLEDAALRYSDRCPTCTSDNKEFVGNPDKFADIDAPIQCDDEWHL